jgi:hypothetical protein
MYTRHKNFDVSNTVDTTDPAGVNEAVDEIFLDLYPSASTRQLDDCFVEVARLYRGEHPDFRACDTPYHNLQHIMEVSLAMARLMNGYETVRDHEHNLGPRLFSFGVITALLHDVGYLRHVKDTRSQNGAEYTQVHVSRSASFIERYMTRVGMEDLAPIGKAIVHFTGYERPVERIRTSGPIYLMLGHMLGTADIMAQMSDRCYLEKCRDRLFREFVYGGLAANGVKSHYDASLFTSAEDLLFKTPRFYTTALTRLNEKLGRVHRYLQQYFRGQHVYLEEMEKNKQHASKVAEERDLSLLRRVPPPADIPD